VPQCCFLTVSQQVLMDLTLIHASIWNASPVVCNGVTRLQKGLARPDALCILAETRQ
jgi:hypothetical protein